RGIEHRERRLAALPGIRDTLPGMAKVSEIETERFALPRHDHFAQGIDLGRLPVRREPHDLVFVAVMREAEVLRERLVEDPERMREVHLVLDRDGAAAA